MQRQHCGAVGKRENCIVLVNLGVCPQGFSLSLGWRVVPAGELVGRPRCDEAGISDEMVYRPKSEITLEQYRRAKANGLEFDWLTLDEWYGSKPQFLRALDTEKQNFVGEVPKSFRGWHDPPRDQFAIQEQRHVLAGGERGGVVHGPRLMVERAV